MNTMHTHADKSPENNSKALNTTDAPQKKVGESKFTFEDNRSQTLVQRKFKEMTINRQERQVALAPSSQITGKGNGEVVQRFLYVGSGSSTPIPQDDFFADVEDETDIGQVPAAVITRIFAELRQFDGPYRSFFTNEILTQRAFPLRLNNWDELTAQRIVDYYENDYLGKAEDDLSNSFKPGDKLYGIHDVKGDAGKTARPNVGRKPQMASLQKILSEAGEHKHVVIDTINNVLGISAGVQVDKATITDNEALEYLAFIENHPRYGPKFENQNEDIKKSCKAALEYVTTAKQNTVHFELSGIDLAQIATKTDGSVTGAELRSIFRRVVRNGWKPGSPGINPSNVQFYTLGKTVPPPWVSEPKLWEGYANQIMAKGGNEALEKLPESLPGGLKQVPINAYATLTTLDLSTLDTLNPVQIQPLINAIVEMSIPHLKNLTLKESQISRDQQQAVRQALPGLTIHLV